MRQRTSFGEKTTGSGRVERPPRSAERGAGGQVAGLHAGLEPLHALGGGAVGEGLGRDAPLGRLLDTIVTDGGGGVERLLDLAGADRALLVRRVPPHAG